MLPIARRTIPVVMALVGLPFAASFARTHSYFAVRDLVVEHRGRLSDDVIRRVADVTPGTSIWDVDLRGIEARIAALPWVRRVEARRRMPHHVYLKVREYRPAAIVALADGDPWLWYVAANGRPIAPVGEGDGRDFPYVTGLSDADLRGDDAFGLRGVRRALGVLRIAGRMGDALGPVSEVHVDRARGLTVMPVRPPAPVELGWGGYATKMDRLGAVLPFWVGREHELAHVSCVFDNEVVVRTRTPVAAVQQEERRKPST